MNVVRCILVVLALFALACTPSAPSDGSSEAPPLKIGNVTAFSGPQANLGEAARMGAELAAREINAAGGVNGRRIELIFRDDEANPTKAVQVVEELISNQRVNAIFGPVNTPNTLAVVPRINEARIIHMTVSSAPVIADPAQHPYTFRTQYYAPQEAAVMVRYFADIRGYRRLALLTDSSAYGQAGAQELLRELRQRGLSPVATESYNIGDASMTGQLVRILANGAEGILAWGFAPDLSVAAKELARLGSTVPMVGPSGITQPVFPQLSGEAGRPHLGVVPRRFTFTESAPAHPKAVEFIGKLDALYGPTWTAPITVSAPWYEMVYLYAEAVRRAGSDDPDRVRAVLESFRDYPSQDVYARWTFTPQKRDGVPLEEVTVAYVGELHHGLFRRPEDAP